MSMSPLFIDNNLADLEDVDEARRNLGLGSMSTMASNDVLITGGKISTDEFKLIPKSNLLSNAAYFLKSVDFEKGAVDWVEIPSVDWVTDDPENIQLSKFNQDVDYVTRESLAPVAFTGDFNDISNIPQSLADIYQDDVLHKFLVIESNLSDIDDPVAARSNLGLGTLASQNSNDVRVTNIIVENSLTLPAHFGNGFLRVDSFSNVSAVEHFDMATDTRPGIVFTCNVNTDDPNSVPTSQLLSNIQSDIRENIASLKLDDVNDMVNSFQLTDKLLFKSNLLSEFSNESDRIIARNNIGLGDICLQSSNDVTLSNLVVDSLKFNQGLNAQKKLLSFDSSNLSTFVDIIDIAPPSASNPGVVYTITDFDQYIPDERSNVSVLTADGFDHFADRINKRITDIQNSIPKGITDLNGDDTYLNSMNNLSDLRDVMTAKSNLGLAQVATSGKYDDLIGKPFAISEFSNDVGFLEPSNNLSDVADKVQARINLGLGTMASQDIDNVKIQGGFVKFEQLEVKREFIFKDEEDTPNGKILVCADANGKMEWGELPRASFTEYGTVKISDHVKVNDTRTDVVPNCKSFATIENNIYRKMELAIRNYVLTPEFTERVLFMDEVKATEFSNMEHEHGVALSNLAYAETQLENTSNLDYQKFLVSNLTEELNYAIPLISNLSSNFSNQSNIIFENSNLIQNQIITIEDLVHENTDLGDNLVILNSNNSHQSNQIFILRNLSTNQSNIIVDLAASNAILESETFEQSNLIVYFSNLSFSYSNDIDDLNEITDDLEIDLDQERRKLSEALQKIEILEGNAYASEYGYLVNYGLVLNENDNSAQRITNSDFFIGVGFDLSPPTKVIIKNIATPLFGMNHDGSVNLIAQNDINGPSNVDLFGGSINIDMDPTEAQHVIPLHDETNLRDAFPVNILDVTTHEGARKFKSDFDNVGSLLYSRDGIVFSGINALCGYVQLSDKNFHAQAVSREDGIFLRRNEIIVDFIAYYHLPILFENVKAEEDMGQYDFYLSSLVSNRLDDMAYRVQTGQTSIENEITLENTSLGNFNVSFYPHIRVIKWKNEYDPSFNYIGNQDISDDFMTALGWGNPMDISTIVAKYLNTNNGSDWIRKLVELTFAHLKHGKPLKTLNVPDMLVVDSIYALVTTSNFASYFQLETLQTEMTFKLKKEAFSGYLY